MNGERFAVRDDRLPRARLLDASGVRRAAHAISRPWPESNPFASRRVRPGAIPFQFPPGVDSSELLSGFRQLGWRASIIGPHGSGKSTLLATLTRDLIAAGHAIHVIALHGGQRRLPREFFETIPPRRQPRLQRPAMIVVVDGYEQLNYWNRSRLERRCSAAAAGLLITAHAPTKLPILFETSTSYELSIQIAEHLVSSIKPQASALACPRKAVGMAPDEPTFAPLSQASSLKPQACSEISSADIHRAWTVHHGNIREMLFELYDLFERRRVIAEANHR
jgi:hypothetical protein